jgi:hypothetical protein
MIRRTPARDRESHPGSLDLDRVRAVGFDERSVRTIV